MRKESVRLFLLVVGCACLASVVGCGGKNGAPAGGAPNDSSVESLVKEINSLTEEILTRIEKAKEPAAGLDEAQKRLDEGKAALRERIAKVKAGREFRESEEARGRLLECEVDNTDRISKLRTRYIDLWMKDAAFKSKLDKVVSDYQDLFK